MKLRVLLDENMAHKLRLALADFDTATVRYVGFAGLKNGELLTAVEAAGFDVFVTGDKTIEYEQNFKDRKIAVIALSAPHWALIKIHVGKIVVAIGNSYRGSFTRVDCGIFSRRSRRETRPPD